MFRCIIVDDEPLARERIRELLKAHIQWTVLAEAGEYDEAKRLIIHHQPDLCFIDINIIGGSGLSLAQELGQLVSSKWIFSTAYGEFAVKAFELNASDYLLKPFSAERFNCVVKKIEPLISSPLAKPKSILAVKSIGEVNFVETKDIIWIKGSANYAELHCSDKMILHRETMSNLEMQLDKQSFIRVHRSAMINIHHVSSLTSELGRFTMLQLNNGDEVRISSSYRSRLFSSLGLDEQTPSASQQAV
ncbi:LytR/AlgR family response regulator transcription factor [Ningiella sp. W23]|uniref:LytR/AlgR family response regulator transcription factor n=1 Tax=Ningiella sp. W23 TaxID=3023715 RepID=UPI0037582769